MELAGTVMMILYGLFCLMMVMGSIGGFDND